MSHIFATQPPRASGDPANVTERSDEPGSVSEGIYRSKKNHAETFRKYLGLYITPNIDKNNIKTHFFVLF